MIRVSHGSGLYMAVSRRSSILEGFLRWVMEVHVDCEDSMDDDLP